MNILVDINIFCDSITRARLATTETRSREVDIEISRFAGSLRLRKRRKTECETSVRLLKLQRTEESRGLARGGGRRKLEGMTKLPGPQGWRDVGVPEGRGDPRPARAEDDRSSMGRKALRFFGTANGYDFARDPNLYWRSGEDNGGHSGSLLFMTTFIPPFTPVSI